MVDKRICKWTYKECIADDLAEVLDCVSGILTPTQRSRTVGYVKTQGSFPSTYQEYIKDALDRYEAARGDSAV